MNVLAPIVESPWCVLLVAVLLIVLVGGAAIVALAERRPHVTIGYPETRYPMRRLAASAPLEALAALHGRLLDLERRLPPGCDDARWLRGFSVRLRYAMDEAYARLEGAPASREEPLLEHLALEVEALAGAVNLQLSAHRTHAADRQALEIQLAALRAAVRQP